MGFGSLLSHESLKILYFLKLLLNATVLPVFGDLGGHPCLSVVVSNLLRTVLEWTFVVDAPL